MEQGGVDIGILLARPPHTRDFTMCLKLAKAAIDKGLKVSIFLMGDAAYGILTKDLQELAGIVEVITCRQNAENRGVLKDAFGKVKSGSQYDLSYMISRSKRFISIT